MITLSSRTIWKTFCTTDDTHAAKLELALCEYGNNERRRRLQQQQPLQISTLVISLLYVNCSYTLYICITSPLEIHITHQERMTRTLAVFLSFVFFVVVSFCIVHCIMSDVVLQLRLKIFEHCNFRH